MGRAAAHLSRNPAALRGSMALVPRTGNGYARKSSSGAVAKGGGRVFVLPEVEWRPPVRSGPCNADTAPMNLAPVADSFSFLQLFLQAHVVVKAVMIGLLLASVWSWAIIIEKVFAFRRARREADSFESQFWSGQSLEELYVALARGRTFSMASLFVAAMREWKRSVEGNIRALGGIQLRVEKVMDVTISREMEQLDRRLLFLATVGSTAPFVGLFGTVWGIMSSFQAIAASKNTSLAVVAPGIAEALFATALGLLAAIPAVIFYNMFAADSSRLAQRLEAFADEFSAIVSRQIDVRT
jgi:biopolymer transport protein TolQ